LEYTQWDSTRGKDQLIEDFAKITDKDEEDVKGKDVESFRVKYSNVDFRPLIFQRKLERLQDSTDSNLIEPKGVALT
jgi:hypothetical protein